jgi:hypothetical protein
VDETFAPDAAAQPDFIQQIDRSLFEDAGANAIDDVFFAAGFEHDGIDAMEMEQVGEQKSRGSGADDAYLGMHCWIE